MMIGYARTSTLQQIAGLDAQARDLKAAGCEKVFSEQTSSIGPRKVLDHAMEFCREGDILTVTKLDRLARNVSHLGEIVRQLEAKGIGLKILDLGIDTTTATGKLMLNMIGAVAQFEREMMLERQKEGIAKAKSEGKYKGRKPTARMKADQIKELATDGMKRTEIAKTLGVSESSVYRVLAS